MGVALRQVGLAGAASAEFVDGVVQLRPEDAMVEAMMRGWRAQQTARGLRADTIGYRERLVRRFLAFINEFPWQWSPAHVDEWTLTLTSEKHLAPSTIRGYQTDLRLFSEFLAFINEFPWQWSPAHVDEWTLTLTSEKHLAPSTIRGYQTDLRLFSEYLAFINEFPWQWSPAHVDEWTLTLTSEKHLAPSTIRGYQTDLRLFSEYL